MSPDHQTPEREGIRSDAERWPNVKTETMTHDPVTGPPDPQRAREHCGSGGGFSTVVLCLDLTIWRPIPCTSDIVPFSD